MQTIVNLGTGGADLNGQNGSTTSADSNDALFLDWPGDNAGNYVYLPGAAGNSLSVPDDPQLDVASDFEIRIEASFDSLSALALSLYRSGAYETRMNSGGTINFRWSSSTVLLSRNSTEAVPYSAGERFWYRCVLDADNGAGGHDVKFYTSSDGSTWTQLGSTVTTAGTTSVDASTTGVNIGTGYSVYAGMKVYRAQILNGINGTTVLDADTSVISSGSATSFTALTGQTVTINRSTSGRKSVAVVSPVWLFGTDDRIEVSHNALIDFSDTDSFSLFIVARRWATDLFAGLVTKQADYDATRQGYGIAHYTESGGNKRAYMSISDGSINESYLSTVSEQAGETYCLSMVRDRFTDFVHYYGNGTLLDTDADDVGDLRNSKTFYIGRYASVARYADAEILAVAVFRRALTSTEVSQLSDYYTSRWS